MFESALREQTLPIGSFGRKSSGWYGVWTLVLTEAAIFVYLLFSYFYLASQANGEWPIGGAPSLALAAPNTLILLASSAALHDAANVYNCCRASHSLCFSASSSSSFSCVNGRGRHFRSVQVPMGRAILS